MTQETITWRTASGEWTAWMRAGGRPETTVKLRRYQLGRFAEHYPDPWAVSGRDLVAWIANHDWAPETRRSVRAGLAGFYGWATRAGYLQRDPSLDLPSVRPQRHLPRPAPEDVVMAGLRAGADARVPVMVMLAARLGMRRGEIARASSADLWRDLAGWSLTVHGKGGRDRILPVPDDVAFTLRRMPAGCWFPGRIDGHLSPARVGELVSAALPGNWTCHTLRHRFGTRAYGATSDLLAVQALLGHAKPETTLNYVQLPSSALRRAVEACTA